MTGRMDDQMNGWMDDKTDGWNDASWRPLLYVIFAFKMQNGPIGLFSNVASHLTYVSNLASLSS